MKKRKIIYFIIIIILFLGGCFFIDYYFKNRPSKIEEWNIEEINLKDVDNLMIVAHPDDETLWGGSELIKNKYLVVCVTCGTDETRVKEFKTVMNKTEDKYIMLGYPDKVKGKRSNWEKEKEDILKDLKNIAEYKDWHKIVTHNPVGEYGHEHHKMTNKYVTDIVDNKSKLVYFGHYYSPSKIKEVEKDLIKLEDSVLDFKVNKLIVEYKSQDFLEEKFSQMYPYENYVTFEEWSNE